MLQDTSYLDRTLSQGELVNKILHQEIPCELLRVVYPNGEDGDMPHAFVYLDFGEEDRLLRLQPGTLISATSGSGRSSINGPVFIRLVEQADAVAQSVMVLEIWSDDDGDASSHPIAWGLSLTLLRDSQVETRLPEVTHHDVPLGEEAVVQEFVIPLEVDPHVDRVVFG